ncbi:MAG TPA: glycosyltransferase family 39 protein [Candidatus Solibacter sp.]|nr:glycosyltransferase family 39 protein [Candidatus Solibacter sp.]
MRTLRAHAALVAICTAYLMVVLIISSCRPPTSDDGWFASPAYNFAHHGHFGTTTIDPQGYLLRPELTHINQRTFWVLPLELAAQVPWYAVFGFGLLQMRLLTALFGLLGIISIYIWTDRITGSRLAANIAALLMAQDITFLWRSADGRMDVMCLGLGMAGQAAYLLYRERSLSKAIVVGNTFVCLAGLTHPNGIILFLTLVVTMVVLDGRRLRLSHIVPFAIPFLIGAAALTVWAMTDLEGFRGQIVGNRAGDRMNLILHPLNAIGDEITRYKYVYVGSQYDPGKFAPFKSVLLIALFGGYLGQLFVNRLKDRTAVLLAICGAIPVLVLTFFNAKNFYYLIYVVPFLAANAGVLFAHWWHGGTGMRSVAVAALAVVLLVSVAVTARRTITARKNYQEYKRLSAQIVNMLPAGETIIGPAEYAFGIGFDRVVQDDNLGYYSRRCPPLILDVGLAPDEVENLRRDAPAVLEHRNQMLTVHYKVLGGGLYQRLSCPAGARAD